MIFQPTMATQSYVVAGRTLRCSTMFRDAPRCCTMVHNSTIAAHRKLPEALCDLGINGCRVTRMFKNDYK